MSSHALRTSRNSSELQLIQGFWIKPGAKKGDRGPALVQSSGKDDMLFGSGRGATKRVVLRHEVQRSKS